MTWKYFANRKALPPRRVPSLLLKNWPPLHAKPRFLEYWPLEFWRTVAARRSCPNRRNLQGWAAVTLTTSWGVAGVGSSPSLAPNLLHSFG